MHLNRRRYRISMQDEPVLLVLNFLDSFVSITHFRLNKHSHAIYWNSLLSILDTVFILMYIPGVLQFIAAKMTVLSPDLGHK